MINVRHHEDRGYAHHGWLETYHSFSFAMYLDPKQMRFRNLRVLNEDFIDPGTGFDMHPHKNMEIVTYIISGTLSHEDSTGAASILNKGDVQVMSAGTGVNHTEYNKSLNEKTHILQMWIFPDEEELVPSYAQQHVPDEEKANTLRLVVSPSPKKGELKIHQDTYVYVATLDKDKSITQSLHDRYGYVQLVSGELKINGEHLSPGDGARVLNEESVTFEATEDAEFLWFDMP